MPLYRKCSICGNKVLANTKCKCEIKRDKHRYIEYAKHRQDKDAQKVYTSGAWEKTKEVCNTRQSGLCLYSYYILDEIKEIELFHHIIEVKQDISKAYDVENVIGVTDSAHKLIHSTYLKGEREKKLMQELLFKLLCRWNKEMHNKF